MDGLKYAPDVVLLFVDSNDFSDIMSSHVGQRAKPYFVMRDRDLVLKNVPVTRDTPEAQTYRRRMLPMPFQDWLSWYSYAYVYLNEYYRESYVRYIESRYSSVKQEMRTVRNVPGASLRKFRIIVLLMMKSISDMNARIIIVYNRDNLAGHPILHGFGDVAIDLYKLDAFLNHEEEPHFPTDTNFNADGHRAVFESLRDVAMNCLEEDCNSIRPR